MDEPKIKAVLLRQNEPGKSTPAWLRLYRCPAWPLLEWLAEPLILHEWPEGVSPLEVSDRVAEFRCSRVKDATGSVRVPPNPRGFLDMLVKAGYLDRIEDTRPHPIDPRYRSARPRYRYRINSAGREALVEVARYTRKRE